MKFKKYQHVERFGTDDADGIQDGMVYVFPKIDGTNGSIWLDDDNDIATGSRSRALTFEQDNHGFAAFISSNKKYKHYLEKYPKHRLYGEYLVPHSLKTYREDAWRKFYVFDVTVEGEDGEETYIPYDVYKLLLEEFDIEYIPPICKIKNPTYDILLKKAQENTFLITDGAGAGEGIVAKRYDFVNKYGRTAWAKVVLNEFKEKHAKVMGASEIQEQRLTEEKIIDDFCTAAFIEKEYAKLVESEDGWRSQYIPMFLNKVYHELIVEETWNIVKKYKNPRIDFKLLSRLVINKVKEVKPELF